MRFLLGALLVLVAASMLVYLIPGGPGGPNVSGQNVIAAVGDDKITTQDVQRAVQNITRGQANLPKGILAMYLPSIVNQLIEGKAMAYKAREMGLRVSDEELGNSIEAEFAPELGGKFDMQVYQSVLAQQGLTPTAYENQRRESMLGARLENIEMQSLVVSDAEAKAEYQRKNLKVGLQYIEFSDKDFASKVDKNPAPIKAYFEKNRSLFRIPEKRNADLIVGNLTDFIQSAQVSDKDVQQQYQDNLDTYRTPERVKVRHILIKTQGKPASEVPAQKAKAEDILKQLQRGGDFAAIAKKDSEDPGSAAKGGELGWIVRGQTVPQFEKAAFSLKPGEMSGVIQTDYGFHILQVEDKQAAHTQSFDEVKPQLVLEAQKQVAGDNFKKAVDAARLEIIKNPAQAASIAAKYNLKFYKVDGMTTTTSMPDINTQPELANAIFAAPRGGTTDVVSMDAQGKDAFAVIAGIAPAHNAEFAEVQNDVAQKYTTAQSQKLAEDAAKAAAARARKGESLDAIAKSYGLTVKTAAPFTIDGAAEGLGAASLVSAAFNDNVGDIVGPVAAQEGQFVCRVSEKIPADMAEFAKNKQATVQSLMQQRQGLEGPLFRNSVVNDLRRRGKVKINQANLSKMIESYQS
ncbi:MAG: peptidyl-prolyl cis-trans isomerase [Acidobacteriaceae bacterium]|nr:peptidyl-prolyl cis-trans isomerase [Acidobacteriota bacterium]MBV8809754.1 peptidyl-prolyl cis-trans isomerase [Acidobacteriaceae bacterium]MBV9498095.1 peptidyl-prolyl cis-trans isomerase [Acidobacteriaceae bacterium]